MQLWKIDDKLFMPPWDQNQNDLEEMQKWDRWDQIKIRYGPRWLVSDWESIELSLPQSGENMSLFD